VCEVCVCVCVCVRVCVRAIEGDLLFTANISTILVDVKLFRNENRVASLDTTALHVTSWSSHFFLQMSLNPVSGGTQETIKKVHGGR
jgi:hypothetical protein